jgi:hypothetical protein
MELKNGAEVLAYSSTGKDPGHVVLARWRENEYATWVTDEDGYAYWGHYFTDLAEAKADYMKRVDIYNTNFK